jgi:hypothetical protein
MKFNTFNFENLDFTNLTFHYSLFPQEFLKRINENKVTHFQLTIRNDKLNESLTVLSLAIRYSYQAFIR